MKKNLHIFMMIVLAFVAGSFVTQQQNISSAQSNFTDDEVIALVANSPQFASALQTVTEYAGGWNAVTFNTQNAYGIWRVYFTSADDESIGWADVNPELGRIYSWDVNISATDAQKEAVIPILKDYLSRHPDILELLDNPASYDYYVDYNGWDDQWGVYIAAGEYALWVTVQFEDGYLPTNLNNPQLTGIYFPDLPDYDQWLQDTQAKAVNIAFANSQVGLALRGRTWTTTSERLEGDMWRVAFLVDDAVVIVATVDIETGDVLEVVTP
ncbi:MAG: hypothetical protein CUN52_03405 [Phototrophicales bacterium]|nr:MAG: hypothetical protein CUN52_03405 [Phototrophicales bacterium]